MVIKGFIRAPVLDFINPGAPELELITPAIDSDPTLI
jgi:hypothetical protein